MTTIDIPEWFFIVLSLALLAWTLDCIASLVVTVIEARREKNINQMVEDQIRNAVVSATHVHMGEDGEIEQIRPN